MNAETQARIAALVNELFATCQRHAIPGKFNLDVIQCAVMLVNLNVARQGCMEGRKEDMDRAAHLAVNIFTELTRQDAAEVERTVSDLFARLNIQAKEST
jgi:hypothetical protein